MSRISLLLSCTINVNNTVQHSHDRMEFEERKNNNNNLQNTKCTTLCCIWDGCRSCPAGIFVSQFPIPLLECIRIHYAYSKVEKKKVRHADVVNYPKIQNSGHIPFMPNNIIYPYILRYWMISTWNVFRGPDCRGYKMFGKLMV